MADMTSRQIWTSAGSVSSPRVAGSKPSERGGLLRHAAKRSGIGAGQRGAADQEVVNLVVDRIEPGRQVGWCLWALGGMTKAALSKRAGIDKGRQGQKQSAKAHA